MAIEVRRATPADKTRMVEIAGQIWEGDDYVPAVADEWLTSSDDSLVAGAYLNGTLIAFARLSWPLPDYAWLEGIRTEPSHENRGAAKAITTWLLGEARRRGGRLAGLSTYIANDASIHIIESHGFKRVAGFVALEAEPGGAARAAAQPATVVEVAVDDALAFVRDSAYLRASQGFLAHGWHFYPLPIAPVEAMAHLRHRLGLLRNGRLAALALVGDPLHGPDEVNIDFLDGDAEGIAALARHLLHVYRDRRWFGAHVPAWQGQPAPALDVLRELGFWAWFDFQPDVFVYTQTLLP